MPSKLRKAIGAVKDQTSISIAKVSTSNASTLGIAILKATTHDEVPVDQHYVNDILTLVASNRVYAAACAQAIGKRIGRTRNWIVALKALTLVLRIFQDGDLHFPKEVLHAMKRGAKILNLSNFRDDSNSSPWDYTAFVRTFALYLDERLNCFLSGKLQRRFVKDENRDDRLPPMNRIARAAGESVREMKPAVLLDRITYWQKLLDRAIATKPTGAAKSHRLVQMSLYTVVQESFDLYRDISDGLALLLDSFFHLQYQTCVSAFQICVKASKQFEELCSFYSICKNIGVGRTSEYPSVQKISDELVETLQEFLKDQSSFPNAGKPPISLNLLRRSRSTSRDTTSEVNENHDQGEISEHTTERGSEWGSQCTSLEDLISACDTASMSNLSIGNLESQFSSGDSQSGLENSQVPENKNETDPDFNPRTDSCFEGFGGILESWEQEIQKPEKEIKREEHGSKNSSTDADVWELVLFETASQPRSESADPATGANSFCSSADDTFPNYSFVQENPHNPFLQDTPEFLCALASADSACAAPGGGDLGGFPADIFSITPTLQPAMNFSATAGEDEVATPSFRPKLEPKPLFQAATSKAVDKNVDSGEELPLYKAKPLSIFQNVSPDSKDPTATTSFISKPTFSVASVDNSATFTANPTFSASNLNDMAAPMVENDPFATENDPFAAENGPFAAEKDPFAMSSPNLSPAGSTEAMEQQNMLHEQQLWLENQNKIIAKHLS